MSFASLGSLLPSRPTFNSGHVTVDTNEVVDVADVKITNQVSEKNYYRLNSIKKGAIRQSNYDVNVSFTTNSVATPLLKKFFSTSSAVSATEINYNKLDAQQIASTIILTVYEDDAATKGHQVTLVNPVITTMNENHTSQEFSTYDVTIVCTDITNYKDISA